MVKRLSILFVLVAGAFLNGQAQVSATLHHSVVWQESPLTLSASESNSVQVPTFTTAVHPQRYGLLPVQHHKLPISQYGQLRAYLSDMVTEKVTGFPELRNNSAIESDFKVDVVATLDRKRPVAAVDILPLRNTSTGIERLVSYKLTVVVTRAIPLLNVSRSYKQAANSVLRSGSWFKIAVMTDGVYKIDHTFMDQLGVDLENVSFASIGLFGNGGGMLPEANSTPRIDDLQENPIQKVDVNLNDRFDEEDHILFYGQGPDRWVYDTSDARFKHIKHLYTLKTYYFLTTDQGSNMAIGSQGSSSASATHVVNSFDDYKFNDFDRVNFLRSGRKWYGDEFGVVTNKNITFSFTNLVTSNACWIRSAMASRSTNESTFFDVTVGDLSYTHSFGLVGPDYTDPHAIENSTDNTFNATSDDIVVALRYRASFSSSQGWLDFIEINARRYLEMTGDQMLFRDMNSVGTGNVADFRLTNATSNLRVWDVTDPLNAREQTVNISGSNLDFRLTSDSLREFVAFDANVTLAPDLIGGVANQDLHGLPPSDYRDMIIVTHADFMGPANELADHHRTKDGMKVEVVDIDQIYNEFSSGAQDLCAVRDYVKMLYDRAGADTTKMPDYLLLFGDGSYDYKDRVGNNTNFIPVYESVSSLDPITSFASDDFYAFLDANEGGNMTGGGNSMDVAVGRIPVKTNAEAQGVVDKIIRYTQPSTFGPWRNMLTFVGDDEDNNTHLNQANSLTTFMKANYPVYNVDKIFLDAYQQEATPGGSRYPDVNDAITQRIHNGTFLMNYTGHGGQSGWAHERVLEINEIVTMENADKLPLFVTATCSFTGFDNPEAISPGEHLMLNPNGGAIALLSTVRLVFSGDNHLLNSEMLQHLFQPVNGEIPRIGDIVRGAKNQIGGNAVNNRKFAYIGDPAIRLAYPEYGIRATTINGAPIDTANLDTLSALEKVTITGEVLDKSGALFSGFNGIVYPTIFDKEKDITTLKNDPKSKVKTFQLQKNIIYKGKASVSNGTFSFSFIVPKDIAYKLDNGRISFYADDQTIDANGFSEDLIIGGTADSFATDNEGPQLQLFMNDEKFAFGGLTNEDPVLIIKLFDESGINTVGNGIGHDVTSVLDNDTKNTAVLNEFYEAALDDYQSGEIRYPFSDLEDGRHSVEVKAWDVHNNSSKGFIEFVVASEDEFQLSHVLNYPNPFTTNTSFQFEHNRPGEELSVSITVYTVAGSVVKTIYKEIQSPGYRIDELSWDGLDEFGDKIGKGVYVYNLTVRTSDGTVANKFEKLFILR